MSQSMTPEKLEQQLVAILERGATLKNSNERGFTLAQLEHMGFEKAFLKKVERRGLIRCIKVQDKGRGGLMNFFCVEVKTDGQGATPTPPPVITQERVHAEAPQAQA